MTFSSSQAASSSLAVSPTHAYSLTASNSLACSSSLAASPTHACTPPCTRDLHSSTFQLNVHTSRQSVGYAE
jgi:hypothetical protein